MQIILDVDKKEVFFSRPQLTRYLSQNLAVLSYDPLRTVFKFTNPLEDDNIKNKLWKYLYPSYRHPLNKGDILRFGKLCLRFKSLNLIDHKGEQIKNEDRSSDHNDGHMVVEQVEGDDHECRICMETQSSVDPFLNICDCARTMPVHMSCIKKWLKAKCEESQSTNTIFYDLKNIKCEVCNNNYPLTIEWKGKVHVLFNKDLGLNENYAIFEMFEKNSSELKGMTVLFFKSNNMEFKVGRAVDNDIVFNDVSVSRVHAKIFFINNKLEIQDCKSKFGSHKKITEVYFEHGRKEIHLQMEKFYFRVHRMKGKHCHCGVKNFDSIDPLTDFNELKNIFGEYVAEEEGNHDMSFSKQDGSIASRGRLEEDDLSVPQIEGEKSIKEPSVRQDVQVSHHSHISERNNVVNSRLSNKQDSFQNLHTSWRQNSGAKKEGSPVNLGISNHSLMDELNKDNVLFNNFKTRNKVSTYEEKEELFGDNSMFSNENVSRTSFQFD